MKLIQFKITEHLIRQALAMPEDAEIVNIIRDPVVPGLFTFVVGHASFPEVLEGAMPLEVSPVITCNQENRPETWMTVDFRVQDATGKRG